MAEKTRIEMLALIQSQADSIAQLSAIAISLKLQCKEQREANALLKNEVAILLDSLITAKFHLYSFLEDNPDPEVRKCVNEMQEIIDKYK